MTDIKSDAQRAKELCNWPPARCCLMNYKVWINQRLRAHREPHTHIFNLHMHTAAWERYTVLRKSLCGELICPLFFCCYSLSLFFSRIHNIWATNLVVRCKFVLYWSINKTFDWIFQREKLSLYKNVYFSNILYTRVFSKPSSSRQQRVKNKFAFVLL